jgi:cytochrome c-type biogenesis protein
MKSMSKRSTNGSRRVKWSVLGPLTALAGTLGLAVIGAAITGSEVGLVVGSVEGVSASSGNFLDRASTLFPLGFAFSAGMVSSVNPCGFAMLPAYLGLYLGDSNNAGDERGLPSRLQRAVVVGSTVTAGFVVMFAIVGIPIGLGARSIVGLFPWIGLAIGVLLTLVGTYILSGGNMYNNVAMRLSSRMGNVNNNSVRGYFTFGVGYGTASLSCTLPIFLAVIGGTFTSETFLDSLLQFVLYGFGMGTVILMLTLGMAVARGAIVGGLRNVLPYVGTISALMLLVSGAFIIYYWLTIGERLERIQSVF